MLGVLFLREDLPAAGASKPATTPTSCRWAASVQPLRGSDSIMWTIKFRNGTLKRFKFPIRTTPEGSIDPYGGKPSRQPGQHHGHRLLHRLG